MKEEILDIAKKVYHNHLTPETATNLLLNLFSGNTSSEQLFCDSCGKPKEKNLDHCSCYEGVMRVDGQPSDVSIDDLYIDQKVKRNYQGSWDYWVTEIDGDAVLIRTTEKMNDPKYDDFWVNVSEICLIQGQ